MTEVVKALELAPVVQMWGQTPDKADRQGDVFTAACLAAIPEPSDDQLIFASYQATMPDDVVGIWGDVKKIRWSRLGLALIPGFTSDDYEPVWNHDQTERTGLRYHHIEIRMWVLHPQNDVCTTRV